MNNEKNNVMLTLFVLYVVCQTFLKQKHRIDSYVKKEVVAYQKKPGIVPAESVKVDAE